MRSVSVPGFAGLIGAPPDKGRLSAGRRSQRSSANAVSEIPTEFRQKFEANDSGQLGRSCGASFLRELGTRACGAFVTVHRRLMQDKGITQSERLESRH
jgi:hypothetical protein